MKTIEKIARTTAKVTLSAVVGHKCGLIFKDAVLKDPRNQTYQIEGDIISFNRRPDGINPIRTPESVLREANNAYGEAAIFSGLTTFVGLSKLEEVIDDRLEKKRMKKLSEVVSEETASETTPVTEEVTEE